MKAGRVLPTTIFVRLDAQGWGRYIGTDHDCVGITDALLANIPNLLDRCDGQPN